MFLRAFRVAGVWVMVLAGTVPLHAQVPDPLADDPDASECLEASALGTTFGGVGPPNTITEAVEFTEKLLIGELRAVVQLTATSSAELTARITAPDGTSVLLHDGQGDVTDYLDVVYSDYGVPNQYPYRCACLMQPAAGARLADFAGLEALGEWTLEATNVNEDYWAFLDDWCIELFLDAPAPAVEDLACTSTLGATTVTWTNPVEYDVIDIFIDGEFVSTVAGDETSFDPTGVTSEVCVVGLLESTLRRNPACCAASTIEFTCSASPGGILAEWVPGGYREIRVTINGEPVATLDGAATSYEYEVARSGVYSILVAGVGMSGDEVTIGECELLGLTEPDAVYCEAPDVRFTRSNPATRTFTVSEEGVIQAVEVSLDLSPVLEDMESSPWIVLTSPDGTSVTLMDKNQSEVGAIDLTFSESGSPYGAAFADCGCLVTLASLGDLSDFTGVEASGEWSASFEAAGFLFISFSYDINEWCLRLFACGSEVPSDLACSESAEGGASVTWTNSAAYDWIEVYRDRELIATVPSGSTSYHDASAPSGRWTYGVVGRLEGQIPACAYPLDGCEVVVGGVTFCDEPGTTLGPGNWDSVERLDFDEDVTLDEVEVYLDATENNWGQLILDLTSPQGTTLRLYRGGSGMGFDVTFSPWGVEFPPGTGTALLLGDGAVLAPNRADLRAFAGESSLGRWELAADLTSTGGLLVTLELNEWCVTGYDGCPTPVPSGLTCTLDGGDVVLAWTPSDDYTRVEIEIDGHIVATLSGDAETHTDSSVPPGRHRYRVRGIGTPSSCGYYSAACEVDAGMASSCDAPALDIAPASTGSVVIEVSEDFVLAAVAVEVRASFEDLESTELWSLTIASPAGTVIELLDPSSDPVDRLHVIFSDEAPYTPSTSNSERLDWPTCGCRLHPYPGSLADLRGEPSAGEWTLALAAASNSEGGTLDDWCVHIYGECSSGPPEALAAAESEGDVFLSWENAADYQAIAVLRDGVEIASLDGSAEAYVDTAPPAGRHDYSLESTNEPDGCRTESGTVRANSGGTYACSEASVSTTFTTLTDTLSIPGSFIVDGVELEFQGSAERLWLESPAGTRVRLIRDSVGLPVDVLFTSEGRPFDTRLSDRGLEMLPEAPADLAQFAGELQQDFAEWTILVNEYSGAAVDSWCLRLYERPPLAEVFLRGDVDGNGVVSGISDGVYLLRWAFTAGPAPACDDSADVNDDGDISAISDAIQLLRWAFTGGAAPPAPGTEQCGPDPTVDELGCEITAVGCGP